MLSYTCLVKLVYQRTDNSNVNVLNVCACLLHLKTVQQFDGETKELK